MRERSNLNGGFREIKPKEQAGIAIFGHLEEDKNKSRVSRACTSQLSSRTNNNRNREGFFFPNFLLRIFFLLFKQVFETPTMATARSTSTHEEQKNFRLDGSEAALNVTAYQAIKSQRGLIVILAGTQNCFPRFSGRDRSGVIVRRPPFEPPISSTKRSLDEVSWRARISITRKIFFPYPLGEDLHRNLFTHTFQCTPSILRSQRFLRPSCTTPGRFFFIRACPIAIKRQLNPNHVKPSSTLDVVVDETEKKKLGSKSFTRAEFAPRACQSFYWTRASRAPPSEVKKKKNYCWRHRF